MTAGPIVRASQETTTMASTFELCPRRGRKLALPGFLSQYLANSTSVLCGMRQEDPRSSLANAISTEKNGRVLRFFREARSIIMHGILGIGILTTAAWVALLGWLLYRVVLIIGIG